jgi:hypothetical protein
MHAIAGLAKLRQMCRDCARRQHFSFSYLILCTCSYLVSGRMAAPRRDFADYICLIFGQLIPVVLLQFKVPKEKRHRAHKPLQEIPDSWTQKGLKVLDVICSKKLSEWFREPVRPTLDFAPDYFTVIKNPMDLGTVRQKLRSGQYETPFEFEKVWCLSTAARRRLSLVSPCSEDACPMASLPPVVAALHHYQSRTRHLRCRILI